MKNYLAALAALPALAIIACSGSKKDDPPPPPPPPAAIVYAAGMDSNGRPQVWKDGTPMLSAAFQGFFQSIYVLNGVVHAAGAVGTSTGGDDNQIAYWRSDRPGTINQFGSGYANAVQASSGSAYISIFDFDSFSTKVLTIDANANITNTLDLGYLSYAVSMDVSGGNIYSAGINDLYGGEQAAAVWRNDQVIYSKPITDPDLFELFACVRVSGSDVHAVGWYEDSTLYVRVGSSTQEARIGVGESSSEGLAVSGGDVFVAGQDANAGYVWKSGASSANFARHFVYGANIVPYYLSAVGSDLYVLTHDYTMDRYTVYKNDARIHAFGAGDSVTAIFVVEQ